MAAGAQLFRQLLADSLVLVAAGAGLGWIFALGATRALGRWSDIQASLAPDTRVLLFSLAVSLLAALLFGLAPLIGVARVSIIETLRSSSATGSRSLSKLRTGNLIAVLQVALCLVLLVGTMLLVRTLRNLQDVNLGFRPGGLLVFGMSPRFGANAAEKAVVFYRDLLQGLRAVPGVESATLMQNRLGSNWSNNTGAVLDGKDPRPGQSSLMRWNAVGPDYFQTLGIPILYGRDISDADGPKAAKIAVVNSTFVKKYLDGREPLACPSHQAARSVDFGREAKVNADSERRELFSGAPV